MISDASYSYAIFAVKQKKNNNFKPIFSKNKHISRWPPPPPTFGNVTHYDFLKGLDMESFKKFALNFFNLTSYDPLKWACFLCSPYFEGKI